ncbi:hypothetical protein HPB49_015599 [Dermacentor silvarum]|uniref:Uncharacterized protein n=1 Tax=Dermacentor silvarum TaxID=543639 RepID=A0ACB8D5V8_DERSI|nr:hypothetical protein HPB49_015599 [Dermacentor silvarum]
MVVTVNKCAKDMVRNFADAAREAKPYDVKLIFGAFGLDVTAQTTFSFSLDAHRDVHNPFILQAKRFFATEYNWRAFLSSRQSLASITSERKIIKSPSGHQTPPELGIIPAEEKPHEGSTSRSLAANDARGQPSSSSTGRSRHRRQQW